MKIVRIDINIPHGILLQREKQRPLSPLKGHSAKSTQPSVKDSAGNTSQASSFYETFKECLLSFNFDFIGLIAGLVLASQIELLRFSPWIISVYPAILSAKGMIGGMLAGRLSTALHVGTVYPRFFRNTRTFYRIFGVIIVITLVTSIFMSLVAILLSMLLWSIDILSSLNIILTVIATMALGLTIALLTILVSILSFRRGLDPDIVVYPIMSTVADAIITVYYIVVVALFFSAETGKILVFLINLLFFLLTAAIFLRNMRDGDFLKDIRETILTLVIVAFIVNFTGTFLGKISDIVENRREIYTIYPALIDMIGDVGSVIGSVTTTRLALGLQRPSISDLGWIREQVFASWAVSLIIFVALSFFSLVLNGIFGLMAFVGLTLILVMTNIIAVPMIIFVSYMTSILTFKGGLDPDNFVIPIESSLADNVTTIALLIVLLITGL
ncbi:magnesium transporter [Candidatus Bathyarchaeota archaeon]|nr:magnesium transporter [Candidatus Bathyarchaeota archaeon]